MATFVSSSGNAGTTSSVTVNAPASIVAGNLLIAICYLSSAGTFTTPSGWTLLSPQWTTTGEGMVYIFYKTATGSEPSTYTFTASNNFACAVILQYSNAGTPYGLAFTGYAGPSSPLLAPSVTAAANDVLVSSYGSWAGITSFSTPTSMASRASTQLSGDETLFSFDQTISSAGATGTRTSTPSSSTQGVAFSFLIPAGVTNISLSRIFKWNVRAALSISRIFKWNVRAILSVTRIFKWNVRAALTPFTRILKWNVRTSVTPFTRIFKWNVIGGVLISRTFVWNTIQTIIPIRILRWNTRASVVPFTRILRWNTRLQVVMSRTLLWQVIQTIILSRIVRWNVRTLVVPFSRTFKWNVVGNVTVVITFLWETFILWTKTMDCTPEVWTLVNQNNAAWTTEPVNSTSWR